MTARTFFGMRITEWQLKKEIGKRTSSGELEPRTFRMLHEGKDMCSMGNQEGMLTKVLL